MIITVTAKQDYKGQIIEKIPADFKVVWQGSASVKDSGGQARQTLTWNVDMKKGETKNNIIFVKNIVFCKKNTTFTKK